MNGFGQNGQIARLREANGYILILISINQILTRNRWSVNGEVMKDRTSFDNKQTTAWNLLFLREDFTLQPSRQPFHIRTISLFHQVHEGHEVHRSDIQSRGNVHKGATDEWMGWSDLQDSRIEQETRDEEVLVNVTD